MSKTRIFLSSTCYDLKALREHIRSEIQGFGHEMLASEYSSFPVHPDLSTVENCKKVVRDHADILVLIVGGKRGSLDPTGARSVVNAEYLEARAKGIPCFIFVDQQVWTLLPIFQKNGGDFSPTVDHPEVFKFVAELKAESRWIYPFSKTEDIIGTLQTQLSAFMRMLLERSRMGTLTVPREFASDPQEVIALLQERPPFWEHLLTCELLDNAINSAKRRMDELNRGMAYRPLRPIADGDVMAFVQKFIGDLSNCVAPMDAALKEIVPSWGPTGVAGNPIEIRAAIKRITSMIEGLVDWETELRFVHVSDKFAPLFKSLRGSTTDILEQLATIAPETRKGIELAKTTPGTHHINIQLKLVGPPTLDRLIKELERL